MSVNIKLIKKLHSLGYNTCDVFAKLIFLILFTTPILKLNIFGKIPLYLHPGPTWGPGDQ